MILLSGHSLTIKNRFQPESMALNLEERNSSATITLGPEAPEITVKDWLRDETEPGKGIVWRVKTVSWNVETQTRTITLEHVIQVLKDLVLFGEIKPGTMSGRAADTKCTARQAAAYALKGQNDWKLGDVEVNPSNPYSFNGDTILSALETITSSLDSVQWEYDMSSYPFTLHIRKKPTGVQCEMRMSRNITTLRRQIDRSRMYTRIYPIGQNNLHIDGNYLSKNEGTWGTVCKVETDNSQDTKEKLKAWAQERLNRHCEPLVTITIGGIDLSRSTGEPLDRVAVLKNCRVPLPDYGTSITAQVRKASWSDKIKEPDRFTVTMANDVEDVASIINNIQKSSGKSSRASAKKEEEDHAWFVDTTEHVGMVAEAVAGPGADKDWSRVASIFVDGTGIHQRVQKAEGDIVTAQTAIEENEESITLEAKRAKDKETDLEGMILVTAEKVAMTVNVTDNRTVLYFPHRNYFPKTGSRTYIYLDVSTGIYYEWKNNKYVTCAGPGAVIAAGNICTQINKDGDPEAVIEAKKIYLLGETIAQKISADYISTKIATIPSLTVQAVTGNTASFGNLYGGSIKFRSGSGSGYAYTDLKDLFVTSLSISQSGNTYTLKANNANAEAVSTVTFSRAVTSMEGSWSGGKLTVTPQPQGTPAFEQILVQKAASWNGNNATVPVYGQWGSSGQYEENTGFSVSVDASARYRAGQATLPTNLGFKTSGITGTSLGTFTKGSASYFCFSVGSNNYYMKINN